MTTKYDAVTVTLSVVDSSLRLPTSSQVGGAYLSQGYADSVTLELTVPTSVAPVKSTKPEDMFKDLQELKNNKINVEFVQSQSTDTKYVYKVTTQKTSQLQCHFINVAPGAFKDKNTGELSQMSIRSGNTICVGFIPKLNLLQANRGVSNVNGAWHLSKKNKDSVNIQLHVPDNLKNNYSVDTEYKLRDYFIYDKSKFVIGAISPNVKRLSFPLDISNAPVGIYDFTVLGGIMRIKNNSRTDYTDYQNGPLQFKIKINP
jgi:hypothetical protein